MILKPEGRQRIGTGNLLPREFHTSLMADWDRLGQHDTLGGGGEGNKKEYAEDKDGLFGVRVGWPLPK